MRRYGKFSALFLSFFSRDLYRDVAHAWGGIGFTYLLLLSALVWTPPILKTHLQLRKSVETDWPQVVKNCPEIKLEKGVVSSTVPQPFVIMDDSKPPKPGFVLDTTGQIKSFEETPARVFVSKTRVYFRDNKQERSIDLKDTPDITINPTKLTEWGRLAAKWFAPVAWLCVMIGSVIWGAGALMFLAILGAMVGGGQSTVSTGGYLRLASVARTPAILLDTLFSYVSLGIPMWWLASFGVSIAYMIYAVNCANEVPRKPFDAVAPPPPEPFAQTSAPHSGEPSCFAAPPSDQNPS